MANDAKNVNKDSPIACLRHSLVPLPPPPPPPPPFFENPGSAPGRHILLNSRFATTVLNKVHFVSFHLVSPNTVSILNTSTDSYF